VKHNANIGLRDVIEGFLFSLRAEGKSNSKMVGDSAMPNMALIKACQSSIFMAILLHDLAGGVWMKQPNWSMHTS
jgi:hypothetical protein